MLFAVLGWLSYIFILVIDVRLYRLAGRRFPTKRKYLIPFLVASLLWPILATIWSFEIGGSESPVAHHEGFLRRQGLWYAFDTHYPVANFLYYHLNSLELPVLLGLMDVLLLGALFCLPVCLITLIRRRYSN